MADRYSYLPLIGISIMLAWGIPSLIKRIDISGKILFTAGIAALSLLAVLTWQQCGYWKNSIELYSHTLRIIPDYADGYYNRGISYYKLGRYQQAIENYNMAITLDRNYIMAYNNRGIAYSELGQYQHALEDFNKAISLNPDNIKAYNNRGNVYFLQGNNRPGCLDVQKACELGNCDRLELARFKGLCL